MIELIPHLSCVASEAEFESLKPKYSEIYVTTNDGTYKYMKLKGGRSITTKVKEIPGYKPEHAPMQEEINFLPAGKVPVQLLHDIIDFFKQVMATSKQEVEAMAHILWNEKDGYHVAVPNQTISKAAVSYGNDHIKRGDIIILDIHSHNTMGAFFSGTDNNDDKNGVYFSAVAGKLNNAIPDLVWRFNIGADKRKASMEDVFETPSLGKADPAWLSKVEVKTYTAPKTGHMGQVGKPGAEFGKNIRPYMEEVTEEWIRQQYGNNHRIRHQGSKYPTQEELDLLTKQNDNDMPLYVPGPMDVDDDDEALDFQDQYIANTYGEDTADAKGTIEEVMGDLEGADEVILDLMKQMYSYLSSEGQIKLATEGI